MDSKERFDNERIWELLKTYDANNGMPLFVCVCVFIFFKFFCANSQLLYFFCVCFYNLPALIAASVMGGKEALRDDVGIVEV